jgi:hypothetical protein
MTKNKGITVISMYRGYDAENFVQIVEGKLTKKQKAAWRKGHLCDEFYKGDGDDTNNMFFRYFAKAVPNAQLADLLNVAE